MLIAAWIRECRNSETQVKLDDVVTPGIRRTRLECHKAILARRTFLGQLWTSQLRSSVICATIAGLSRCHAEIFWTTSRLGRGSVVFDGTRQPGIKHHCVGNNDHSTYTRGRFQNSGSVDHFRRPLHKRIG